MTKITGDELPVCAFGDHADIMDLFVPASAKELLHGGTFESNPMVMAAGLASP